MADMDSYDADNRAYEGESPHLTVSRVPRRAVLATNLQLDRARVEHVLQVDSLLTADLQTTATTRLASVLALRFLTVIVTPGCATTHPMAVLTGEHTSP